MTPHEAVSALLQSKPSSVNENDRKHSAPAGMHTVTSSASDSRERFKQLDQSSITAKVLEATYDEEVQIDVR